MDTIKTKLKKLYIFGRYVDRDWRRILTVFVVLLIVLGIWSFLFTLDVKSKNESLDLVLESAGPQTTHTQGDELKDLIALYDKKNQMYTALFTSSSTSLVDPSR